MKTSDNNALYDYESSIMPMFVFSLQFESCVGGGGGLTKISLYPTR